MQLYGTVTSPYTRIVRIVAAPLSDSEIDDLAAWYASIKITVTLPE